MTYFNQKSKAFQHKKIAFQHDPTQFLGILSEKEVLEVCEDVGLKFRQRFFNPFMTLWLFVWQTMSGDHSCRAVLMHFISFCQQKEIPLPSSNTAAYCKARKRLPEKLIKILSVKIAQKMTSLQPPCWLWKKRQLKLVDGTTCSMPDTKENQFKYPQQTEQKTGVGFPIMRLVGVFSVSCGTLLAAAMGPYRGKGAGEGGLFRQILDVFTKGDIALFDRYYSAFWIIGLLQKRGVDIVSRQHQQRKVDFRRGKKLGPKDHIIHLKKPKRSSMHVLITDEEYNLLPEEILLREIEFCITKKGFRSKSMVIITTLLDAAEYTTEDIQNLYRQRWNVELDFRTLKSEMNMDILRGLTPELVQKEVWVYFLS